MPYPSKHKMGEAYLTRLGGGVASASTPCEVLAFKVFAQGRPFSRRSFHSPKDYCLRVSADRSRLPPPPAGRFGAWLCMRIRTQRHIPDKPGSPGLALQCVAMKIDGGKTSPRVA